MKKHQKNQHHVFSHLVTATIVLLLSLGLSYMVMQAWSFSSVGFYFFLFGVALFASCASIVEYVMLDKYSRYGIDVKPIHVAIWVSPLVVLVFIGITALVCCPIFHSHAYRDVITVEEGNFAEDFEDVAQSSTFVTMDLDTARRLGDRALGSVPNATWYEIDGEYNLILYQGKQYSISPMNYGGFFKYMKAKQSGIPGYVLVDCEENTAKFITTSPIKYSPSAYFGDNLRRHLREQFPSLVFESHFMEIDENGTPYWVTAVSVPKVGIWSARMVESFILTNACTGESEQYLLSQKPEWLDHVTSLDYMMTRVGWHYDYVNGWWNFSKTGVLKTTYYYAYNHKSGGDEPNFFGYNSYVSASGDVMVFTGVTPANQTESNVGFLTINAGTNQYTYYAIPGAEESSAQSVVEGLIQNMGYQATYPIMVNVAGNPTYLMNLKDKSGLIQRYAMVSLENYANAYVGETFEETLTGYLKVIHADVTLEWDDDEVTAVEGTIEQKYQAELDGTTYFYYVINGKLYRASIKLNEEQVLFQVGDSVSMEVTPSETVSIIHKIVR